MHSSDRDKLLIIFIQLSATLLTCCYFTHANMQRISVFVSHEHESCHAAGREIVVEVTVYQRKEKNISSCLIVLI